MKSSTVVLNHIEIAQVQCIQITLRFLPQLLWAMYVQCSCHFGWYWNLFVGFSCLLSRLLSFHSLQSIESVDFQLVRVCIFFVCVFRSSSLYFHSRFKFPCSEIYENVSITISAPTQYYWNWKSIISSSHLAVRVPGAKWILNVAYRKLRLFEKIVTMFHHWNVTESTVVF